MDTTERREYAKAWVEQLDGSTEARNVCTGKTTAVVLEAFAAATRNPGKWIFVYESETRNKVLLDLVKSMRDRLGFKYQIKHNNDIQIKFEVADARGQR